MKKRIFMIFFAFILCSMFCLSGCFFKNNYLSVVSTDRDYKATLTYRSKTSSADYIRDWKVLRTKANICGEQRQVIYIEYSITNQDNHTYDYELTLMFVQVEGGGKVFALKDGNWQKHTGSFGDKWSDIYGSYSAPSRFVYELTQDINGRDFPKRFKTAETSEYIEYTFDKYNERFKISNDMYHICLEYNFAYETTLITKQASFVYGTPADTIPNLSTLTTAVFED